LRRLIVPVDRMFLFLVPVYVLATGKYFSDAGSPLSELRGVCYEIRCGLTVSSLSKRN